ncbi:hypothetical protein AUR04nite_29600 [Glutamicibacter uratoxydans]|uniref:Uncharacterized protein n=1 Tax=Glutamicibacter uratoxydans TaxID=43667 RepID=A0A4Y4DVM6_GLUUR|nr:hypothetical protein [Glutamicibacter uratoxydans]GED07428.1 hypothetical protein AUR04nite_29600 [Glutamicibacter uratoxydans]
MREQLTVNATTKRNRRFARGATVNSQAIAFSAAGVAFLAMSRQIGMSKMFSGDFPPALGYLAGLAVSIVFAAALFAYLPQIVAFLLDAALMIGAIVWFTSDESLPAMGVFFGVIVGATSGIFVGMLHGMKLEEREINQRRRELAEKSRLNQSLGIWWRDGHGEFEDETASVLDAEQLVKEMNGRRKVRLSLFRSGAQLDLLGGAKQGYVAFYSPPITAGLSSRQWKQLKVSSRQEEYEILVAGQSAKKRAKYKTPSMAFPGFRPGLFTGDMLNGQAATLEAVRRFCATADVDPFWNWVDEEPAYSAQPLAAGRQQF